VSANAPRNGRNGNGQIEAHSESQWRQTCSKDGPLSGRLFPVYLVFFPSVSLFDGSIRQESEWPRFAVHSRAPLHEARDARVSGIAFNYRRSFYEVICCELLKLQFDCLWLVKKTTSNGK